MPVSDADDQVIKWFVSCVFGRTSVKSVIKAQPGLISE